MIITKVDFEVSLVEKIINDCFDIRCPSGKVINLDDINKLSNDLVDDILKELNKLKRLFKYTVTVFIQQKNGAGLSFGSNT
jgi:hypothetical protein